MLSVAVYSDADAQAKHVAACDDGGEDEFERLSLADDGALDAVGLDEDQRALSVCHGDSLRHGVARRVSPYADSGGADCWLGSMPRASRILRSRRK